jgi:sterol O-acyltransferase
MKNVRIYEAKVSLTEHLVQSDPQFQAVYDAVLVQGVIFVIYVLVHDFWIAGSPSIGLNQLALVVGTGSTFFYFLCLEAYLLLCAVAVYPVFLSWVWCHKHGPPLLVGLFYLVVCASHVVLSSVIVSWTVFGAPLTNLTALIAGIEQIRLLMKSYSFIRENAYKVLYPWHKDDKEGPAVWYGGQMEPQVGSFSAYLYFLFCPTLLYRDRYPRVTGPINWTNAAGYFVHFLTTIWYMVVLFRYFLFPASFKNEDLVKCYISALLLAFLLLVIIHMCVFHAFANLASELTRFADRQFYNDWWASTSFSSYYRKWNTIVHDWIYSYLFLDMCAIFSSKLPAILSTLFLSAFIHEYLLAMALGFASPFLMVQFAGLGAIFYFMRSFASRRVANLIVLGCLSLGMANLIFYYTAEIAARTYCPRQLTLREFFVPRMFECYMEHNST